MKLRCWMILLSFCILPAAAIAQTVPYRVQADIVPPVNGVFFVAAEAVKVNVNLVQNNGSPYTGTVERFEYRVIGPKQDIRRVIPVAYLVQNGNPKLTYPYTFEFNLPADAQPGTYAVMIRVKRGTYDPFLLLNFQVGQSEVTLAPVVAWNRCYHCHETVQQHGFSQVDSCVFCHTQDFELPLSTLSHQIHRSHGIRQCLDCHKDSQGNDQTSVSACKSCHTAFQATQHMGGVTDDRCVQCHNTGNISPDSAHRNLASRLPVSVRDWLLR